MDVSITIPAQTVTIPEQDITISIPVAKIVYQNAWLNQTSVLSENFISLSQPGLYRVSAYSYCVSNPTVGAAGVYVYGFIQDATTQNLISFTGQATAGGVQHSSTDFNPLIVGVTGSQNSSLSVITTISDPSHIMNHYDVYVTIEQLQ